MYGYSPPLFLCLAAWVAWVAYWRFMSFFTLRKKKSEGLIALQHGLPTAIGLLLIFHGAFFPELAFENLYAGAVCWLGVPLTIAGFIFAIWARLHLGKYWSGTVALKHGHKLIDTGPYAFVRHPIYTGLLTAVLGSAIAAGTLEGYIGFFIMVPAYIIKWRREEKLMKQEFGSPWDDYVARTKAIIPYLV